MEITIKFADIDETAKISSLKEVIVDSRIYGCSIEDYLKLISVHYYEYFKFYQEVTRDEAEAEP